MRLVFMGTPHFAIPTLESLISSHHRVVGVVTQTDKPRGRGLRAAPSPVKKFIEQAKIPILQPDDLRNDDFLRSLKEWQGDCFVVVAFRILPSEVYEMPPKGTINLHASLLPKYRGAAPIQWALINGEERTGVSVFFIDKKIDTGDLILQKEISIEKDETAGKLHDRLAVLGAELILETVDCIERNQIKRIPQKGEPTLAPKILSSQCKIDWSQPAVKIVNLIRGLSPYPGAYTFWKESRLKILQAYVVKIQNQSPILPGKIIRSGAEGIVVSTGDGCVCVRELLLEGGKPLSAETFLRGHTFPDGVILGG